MKANYIVFILLSFLCCFYSFPSSKFDKIQPRKIRAAPSTDPINRRWPNGEMSYVIDFSMSNYTAMITQAMRAIENSTCIRFVPRTTQQNYLLIKKSEQCREPVGLQGGQQKLEVRVDLCGTYGFFLHALMQTLGFYHEHQRFDRDEYINVYLENVQPELHPLFTKLDETIHFYNSTYDVGSIMHYGSFQFSDSQKPAILTKNGDLIESFLGKTKLSNLDIQAINEYYECHKKKL
jgi:hypothetical protein